MENKILILYSTVDGHTKKITDYISDKIQSDKYSIDLISIEDKKNIDVLQYKALLIASSIRYGKHHPDILDFINNNHLLLNSIPTAFASINLVARKPEKSTATTNPYVIKFLNSIQWKPTLVGVFAGVLNYKAYSFWDRIMIQFIMWMTKGPTKADTCIEYTQWTKVDLFIKDFKNLLPQQ